jgi:glutamate-ammonia-ligase adenylyltransferase
VEAFEEYQQKHAWVWEHQALTRARYCAGDAKIGAAFEHIRTRVLQQHRELPKLRDEIVAMRQKMHDGHPNKSALFDIKHDAGGMVDIEFIVQYLVLAHAHAHPELVENKGNLALLQRAADAGLIPPESARPVAQLYRELRRIQHAMRLNNLSPRVEPDALDISACLALWKVVLT